MIRRATVEDIPEIVDLGVRFHAASPYSGVPYDPEKVASVLRQLLDIGVVVVCDADGIKGAAAAMKAPIWFTSEGETAQELFWYAEDCGREAHGLRGALEDWARAEGCVAFSMVCLENPKAQVLSRLYRMSGFRSTEHHFLKVF